MDDLFHGKPYEQMDALGGFTKNHPYFWFNTHMAPNFWWPKHHKPTYKCGILGL